MTAFFNESSDRLLKNSLKLDSIDFKVDHLGLFHEKHRHGVYVHRLADVHSNDTQRNSSNTNDIIDGQVLPDDSCNGIPVDTAGLNAAEVSCSAVAACYTQYYKEMITYFNKLLTTIELNNIDKCSSSEEEGLDDPQVVSDDESAAPNLVHDGDYCSDPRAVMQQYFERYGVQGRWDWVSWNNYLSWIARTYPRWYNIFMEYSRSIGIDWREMYKRWSHSDTTGEHSLPVYAYPITSDGNSVGLQGGFLYEGDDLTDELYCQTCKQRFSSERTFTIHLRAVTHTQNVLLSASKCSPVTNTVEEQPSLHHNGRQPDQELHYQIYPGSEFITPGTFFCELCQVSSMSEISLRYHLNGRLHKENVAIFYQTGDLSQLLQKRAPRPKIDIRLQPLLDVCTKPLVGLNYITEFQFTGDDGCAYACELCTQQLAQQETITHVCGTSHRFAYFHLHYPELFAIVANDRSDVKYRLLRVDYFSRRVEDFEGRKRMKVQRFTGYTPLLPQVCCSDQTYGETVKESSKTSQSLDIESSSAKPIGVSDGPEPVSPQFDDVEEGEVTEDSSDENTSHANCVKQRSRVSRSIDLKAYELQLPHHAAPLSLNQEVREFIDILKSDGFLQLNAETVEKLTGVTPEDHFEHEADWALCRVNQFHEDSSPQHQSIDERLPTSEGVFVEDQLHPVTDVICQSDITDKSEPTMNKRLLTSSISTCCNISNTPAPLDDALTLNLDVNTYPNHGGNTKRPTNRDAIRGRDAHQEETTESQCSPRRLGMNMQFPSLSANQSCGRWRQYGKTDHHLTAPQLNTLATGLPDWRFPPDELPPLQTQINYPMEACRPRLIRHPMLPPTKPFPGDTGYLGGRCDPNRLFRLPVTPIERDSNIQPSDAMFDGYALYSRRGDRKARRLPEPMPIRFPKPRKMAGGGGTSSGRKLSAIADFLGINEPPAPCSRVRDPPAHGVSVRHMRAQYNSTVYEPAFHKPVRFTPIVPAGISIAHHNIPPTHVAHPMMPVLHPTTNIQAFIRHPTVLHPR